MAPTSTEWSVDFDTVRREKLFRDPPTDRTPYPLLKEAIEPHVESFNAVWEEGGLLQHAVQDIGTKVFADGDQEKLDDGLPRNTLRVRIKDTFFDKSTLPMSNKFSTTNREIYPAECRERHSTYRGRFTVRLEVQVNDRDAVEMTREMGHLPIMVMSNHCHLRKCSPAQLVHHKEETEEMGGYYIVNGIEKVVRFLIMPKRNFPLAISRPSFQSRGKSYTPYAIQVRSVRPDETSQTNVLHYLDDGNIMFRFSWRKQEYVIPAVLVLKALVDANDREIFEGILGFTKPEVLKAKQFVIDRVESLLRTYKAYNIHRKSKARAYLGLKFRPVVNAPADATDEEVGTYFLRKIVLPHLGWVDVTEGQNADKFNLLVFMIRKLYALVQGECAIDNSDAVSNQEILMGGFLYGMLLKERLEEWLFAIRTASLEWCRLKNKDFADPEFLREFQPKILKKTPENIGRSIDYFLSTGNLSSPTGLDLQQVSGFSMVAEKLNFYRFISTFRAVHRGSFFAQQRTTTVRKLLGEAWGFLCPVHTPDGAPCGLLNHFAHTCKIATKKADVSAIPGLISGLGITQGSNSPEESVVVQLDGRILGYCTPQQARIIGDTMRYWKVAGSHNVPLELEIGFVPTSRKGAYPGVYMSSTRARMYRPVKYLPLDKQDYVGPFEQPFLSIACTDPEIISGDSTHVEFDPTNILSIVANMTPFSDFNQSPRNMYQCQMGKQTMGTPGAAIRYRTDNKLYRLQTGQTPLVRTALHNSYGLDNFPQGTNAVVAVIAYTGYDMDDAMIINKSSQERGFGYGTIYKTKKYELEEKNTRSQSIKTVTSLFGFAPGGLVKKEWRDRLDEDGLPRIGIEVREGDILAASHDVTYDPALGKLVNRSGITNLLKYKEVETAFIEEVRILGAEDGSSPLNTISIKFRIPRSPVIGDKFSSRHGQKGVCSQKWPAIDMPFSESGIQPDVIINPHAFPSRMTIGMFVESLAGKSGALHGLAQDATPFKFEDRKGNTAVEYFGTQLQAAGYNYYGNEPMYSGVTGEELAADIYVGVVYYQRLRHMVNDKYQVRTTGPVNQLTGQPVKGRSKGGGIRVGEMERDALIAHGTAFLLQDRLLNCSDYTRAWLCAGCGTFLGATPSVGAAAYARGSRLARSGHGAAMRCRRCAVPAEPWQGKNETWEDGAGMKWSGGEDMRLVAVPGVLLYLNAELAAMGVKMKFDVSP